MVRTSNLKRGVNGYKWTTFVLESLMPDFAEIWWVVLEMKHAVNWRMGSHDLQLHYAVYAKRRKGGGGKKNHANLGGYWVHWETVLFVSRLNSNMLPKFSLLTGERERIGESVYFISIPAPQQAM
jgi:hypothetical protein